MNPVVSVLVPTYNAGDYLLECMDSLIGQTYRELEIIAINDGSTDGSLEVLKAYAEVDGRIRIIDKPNSGYGDSMNQGLKLATGKYIGIVEPDDFADADMYKTYVQTAERYGADIVKSGFYLHEAGREEDVHNDPFSNMRVPINKPFAPADHPQVLTAPPSIWSGIYRREMLARVGIDFAPTPGASFQDTSFFHMCWAAADTAVVLNECFLRYRVDNEASSSNSTTKVFATCDEYARALAFMEAHYPEKLQQLGPAFGTARFGAYVWNYNRIAPELRPEFIERWAGDLADHGREGLLDCRLLYPASIGQAELLKRKPELFQDVYPGELEWPGYCYEGISTEKKGSLLRKAASSAWQARGRKR